MNERPIQSVVTQTLVEVLVRSTELDAVQSRLSGGAVTAGTAGEEEPGKGPE